MYLLSLVKATGLLLSGIISTEKMVHVKTYYGAIQFTHLNKMRRGGGRIHVKAKTLRRKISEMTHIEQHFHCVTLDLDFFHISHDPLCLLHLLIMHIVQVFLFWRGTVVWQPCFSFFFFFLSCVCI